MYRTPFEHIRSVVSAQHLYISSVSIINTPSLHIISSESITSLPTINITYQYELDYYAVSVYFLIQMMMIKYYQLYSHQSYHDLELK